MPGLSKNIPDRTTFKNNSNDDSCDKIKSSWARHTRCIKNHVFNRQISPWFQLPVEIRYLILSYLESADLASISRTCSLNHCFIKSFSSFAEFQPQVVSKRLELLDHQKDINSPKSLKIMKWMITQRCHQSLPYIIRQMRPNIITLFALERHMITNSLYQEAIHWIRPYYSTKSYHHLLKAAALKNDNAHIPGIIACAVRQRYKDSHRQGTITPIAYKDALYAQAVITNQKLKKYWDAIILATYMSKPAFYYTMIAVDAAKDKQWNIVRALEPKCTPLYEHLLLPYLHEMPKTS